jgi:hypothetical protein
MFSLAWGGAGLNPSPKCRCQENKPMEMALASQLRDAKPSRDKVTRRKRRSSCRIRCRLKAWRLRGANKSGQEIIQHRARAQRSRPTKLGAGGEIVTAAELRRKNGQDESIGHMAWALRRRTVCTYDMQ